MRVGKVVLGVCMAAATLIAIEIAAGQVNLPGVLSRERQGDNLREITADSPGLLSPGAPAIGFIDSPSPTCYQPDPAQNICHINWYYFSVNAAPATYMLSMTVALNPYGTVANVSGFFQSSIYVPFNMLGQGFRVPCGNLGAGGNPQFGNAYAYTIRARDSNGQSSSNNGTIFCPAYTP